MTTHFKKLLARILHLLFEAGLAIKALLTSIETFSGLGLLFAPNPLVARFVYWATHHRLAADPNDTMAMWTRRAVEQFPVHIQTFYGWYLLAHGGLKLAMVLMLWMRVLWAYPAAMVVLMGFVIYQIAEFVHAGSPVLLPLACLDLIMVGLVWQEYRVLKAARSAAAVAAAKLVTKADAQA